VLVRQILQEAIALRQAKLDRINSSNAEGKASKSRPHVRKTGGDGADDHQEPPETVEQPKAKRPKLALSHLGDEDE